jgi:hypothetical protein
MLHVRTLEMRERERDGLEAFFLLGDLALAFGTC